MDEERRPPAAVSATAMVWLRSWRRVVTSFRMLRMEGGGKWAEASEELILAIALRWLDLKGLEMESALFVSSWDIRGFVPFAFWS